MAKLVGECWLCLTVRLWRRQSSLWTQQKLITVFLELKGGKDIQWEPLRAPGYPSKALSFQADSLEDDNPPHTQCGAGLNLGLCKGRASALLLVISLVLFFTFYFRTRTFVCLD